MGRKIVILLGHPGAGKGTQARAIMNTIRTSLLQVVDEIAAERKATLVLSKNQVVLSAKEYDITDEAMKRLNAKLPTVAVEIPK